MRSIYQFISAIVLLSCFAEYTLFAQHLSGSYEVRYFSKDPKANGETDFKGETTTLDNDKRIDFLRFFGNEVSSYYGDKDLNTEVVTDKEAKDFLESIRPQPLPAVRKRIILDEWKWISYRAGQHESKHMGNREVRRS